MVSASTVAFTALPISLFAPAAAFLVAFWAAASQYVSVPAGMALPPPTALLKSKTPVTASDYRAAPAPAASTDGGQMNASFLSLGIGKSIVIDLPRDIKDVLVADPKIANAVVRSAQRAYIIGATVGQTNIVFFDPAGAGVASAALCNEIMKRGVRMGTTYGSMVRAVTHHDVSAADIDTAADAVASAVKAQRRWPHASRAGPMRSGEPT